jgi:hypothetical protein
MHSLHEHAVSTIGNYFATIVKVGSTFAGKG